MVYSFNIVLIQPNGYIHSLALLELAEYLQFQISACGYQSRLVKNRFDYNSINVVLGGHLLKSDQEIPSSTIIFNSEQFGDDNPWTKNSFYLSLLKKFYVWDYSSLNISALGLKNAANIDIVYEKRLDRLNNLEIKEFDLLFYGSINDRRKLIIERLIDRGIKVKCIFNLYSKERDYYLERTLAVLNLHYYDAQVFQQIRAFYPMINGVPVISEDYPEISAPKIYEQTLFKPNGRDFVSYVQATIANKLSFHAESNKKLSIFKSSCSLSSVERAIHKAINFFKAKNIKQNLFDGVYKKINLGSGLDYKIGFLNIDSNPTFLPDLLIDISKPLILPCNLKSINGSPLTLTAGQFDKIIAHNVFHQINNIDQAISNCLMLLINGGRLEVTVPYDLSITAWADSSSVRAFNEKSWLKYTKRFWEMGWIDSRFDITEFKLNPSELGNHLLATNIRKDQLVATPRAIDSISVVLVKTTTSQEERTQARSFIPGLIL